MYNFMYWDGNQQEAVQHAGHLVYFEAFTVLFVKFCVNDS